MKRGDLVKIPNWDYTYPYNGTTESLHFNDDVIIPNTHYIRGDFYSRKYNTNIIWKVHHVGISQVNSSYTKNKRALYLINSELKLITEILENNVVFITTKVIKLYKRILN